MYSLDALSNDIHTVSKATCKLVLGTNSANSLLVHIKNYKNLLKEFEENNEIVDICVYRDLFENHDDDDKPMYYDNLMYIGVRKSDVIEWLRGDDFDEFIQEYTADDTDGLVQYLHENNKPILFEDLS